MIEYQSVTFHLELINLLMILMQRDIYSLFSSPGFRNDSMVLRFATYNSLTDQFLVVHSCLNVFEISLRNEDHHQVLLMHILNFA